MVDNRERLVIVGWPVAAFLLALFLSWRALNVPQLTVLGAILIGVPAALVGIVLLYRRKIGAGVGCVSVALFFLFMMALLPFARQREERLLLAREKAYAIEVIDDLEEYRRKRGGYPPDLDREPFNHLETPLSFTEGDVVYLSDRETFVFLVARKQAGLEGEIYSSSAGEWRPASEYPEDTFASERAFHVPGRAHCYGPAGRVWCDEMEDVNEKAWRGMVEAVPLVNLRMPADDLVTGGQPTPEQMIALRDLGFGRFISLRPSDEQGTGWEEAFTDQENIDFIRIPVAGVDGVTRENAERLAAELARPGAERAVVYCASGNRVGALLTLKAYWLDLETAVDSLYIGQQTGLTRLEPTIREMIGLREAED